ncbi:kinase-like protein [Tothia fuscella]|uniref:Kinase-like protein n=1 Tax=Tothia fuscella TaxID=1048955 RepID=A0A9P4U3X1_9PEZI|nr:kinase-like protein [Tothia fuscella]
MSAYSPWLSQNYLPHTAAAPPRPGLRYMTSMQTLNLHEDTPDVNKWERSPSPSLSTISTRSSTPTNVRGTHAFRLLNLARERRSRTPPQHYEEYPPIAFKTNSFTAPRLRSTRNPWEKAMNRTSPSVSPRSSPPSQSSYILPEASSRATTPIAPIPLRPIMGHVFSPQRYDSPQSNGSSRYDPAVFTPPESDCSSQYAPNSRSPPTRESKGMQTEPPPIEYLSPELQTQLIRSLMKLVANRGWDGSLTKLVQKWVMRAPKIAILLWMCGEIDALRKAATLYYLTDKDFPFQEDKLVNIASNPARVVQTQWRVITDQSSAQVVMKKLPRGGKHTEFRIGDDIPLQTVDTIVTPTARRSKRIVENSTRLVKVKYMDDPSSVVYVRKRFEINYSRAQDKTAILEQIHSFHRLDHKNIARIVSSYARGSVVAFTTPLYAANLEECLEQISQSEKLLGWIRDLSSALAHIHSKGMFHKNINPQKILIDSQDRIYFSVFGVCPPVRDSPLYEPFSDDVRYIYAPPEVIAGDRVSEKSSPEAVLKRKQAIDTYSLGCIMFELVAKAKGRSLEDLRAYRSDISQDNSFHMNLDRVMIMVDNLHTTSLDTTRMRQTRVEDDTTRMRQTKIEDGSKKVLAVLKPMMSPDPEKRPSMRRVMNHFNRVPKVRRGSFDVLPGPNQSSIWGELSPLQSFYHSQPYGKAYAEDRGQSNYGDHK